MLKIKVIVITLLLLVFLFSSLDTGTAHNRGVISFTVDDGKKITMKVYKLFKEENYPASAAVYVKPIQAGDNKFLSLNQIKELQFNGWEILSHFVSHTKLSNLDYNQLEDELSNSARFLNANGIKVKSFVAPFSECPRQCLDILQVDYESAFTVYKDSRNSYAVINPNTNKYQLYRVNIDTLSLEKMKEYVDYANAHSVYISFYMHGLDLGKYISSNDLQILLEYIREQNVIVTTPSDAITRIES